MIKKKVYYSSVQAVHKTRKSVEEADDEIPSPIESRLTCPKKDFADVTTLSRTQIQSRLLAKGFVPTYDIYALPEDEDEALKLANEFLSLFKVHIFLIYKTLHDLVMALDKDETMFEKLIQDHRYKHKDVPSLSRSHYRPIFDGMDATLLEFIPAKKYSRKMRQAMSKFLQVVYFHMAHHLRAEPEVFLAKACVSTAMVKTML